MATKPSKTPLTAAEKQQRTLRAHQKQLESITALVHRELVRGAVLPDAPRQGWTLDDSYPTPEEDQPADTAVLRFFVTGTQIPAGTPPDPNVLSTACPDPLPTDAHEGAQLTLEGRPGAVLGAALFVQDALDS